jgi:hypothetical protein
MVNRDMYRNREREREGRRREKEGRERKRGERSKHMYVVQACTYSR